MKIHAITTLAVLAASLGLAHAAPVAESALPAPKTQGAVTYLSGGVGEDEAAAMKRAASTYPLELEFVVRAKPKDEYTADVRISVADKTGKTVLDTKADGPFLLAKLPPGQYTVTATQGGQAKTHRVHVIAGKHQRIVFEWAA